MAVENYFSWTKHHFTLLFFYCLLIALFVTVCIYTYAGEQENLSTRKFKNVDIDGTLNLKTEVVTITDATTISFDKNKIKTYVYKGSDPVTVTMPKTKDIISSIRAKGNGARVYLGNIINLGTGTVTLDWTGDDYLIFMGNAGKTRTVGADSNVEFNMEVHDNSDNESVVVWMD